MIDLLGYKKFSKRGQTFHLFKMTGIILHLYAAINNFNFLIFKSSNILKKLFIVFWKLFFTLNLINGVSAAIIAIEKKSRIPIPLN